MEKSLEAKKINKFEEIKNIKAPISVYEKLDELSRVGVENLSDEDRSFFLKCFELYFKNDGKFIIRLRISAGQLTTTQVRTVGEISKLCGDDYIDITTRQQLELRNIITSSFDGLGDKHIIECKPIIDKRSGNESFESFYSNNLDYPSTDWLVRKISL